MTESTLSIVRTDLQRHVGRLLGFGQDVTRFNPDQKVQVNDCIAIGLRSVYEPLILPGEQNAHQWSFLQPIYESFAITAPYETGTVTVVNGVVTLASGTWPTWAAYAVLVIEGSSYSVATRDSNSQLTLDNTTLDADALTEYSLRQVDYDLPDLFGGMSGDVYFGSSSDLHEFPIRKTSIEQILAWRQMSSFTSEPWYYAVQVVTPTGTTPTRWRMSLWPPTDADRYLSFSYTLNPYNVSDSTPYPAGGYPMAEVLRVACLAAAEFEIKRITDGPYQQLFLPRLAAAISYDRQASNPRMIGMLTNPRGDRGQYPFSERDLIRSQNLTPIGYSS